MCSQPGSKRIVVVGCGAIGSLLAEALVRLGAGLANGELTLIDPDILKPENLGRHALGHGSLLKHKSSELAEELKRKFPLVRVTSKPEAVTSKSTFGRADLVIDATGEESVSELLNGLRLDKPKTHPPILHVRIRGNGEAVQTFWAEGDRLACFRCLLNAESANDRKERFPLLKSSPVRIHRGCTGFTPFSVAAPLSATALATDVIVDWLQTGDTTPRFRTRTISNADVYRVKDQDVSKQPKCPACSK